MPDSTEQFCLPVPSSELSTQTCFIKLVFWGYGSTHTNEERKVTTTHFLQLPPVMFTENVINLSSTMSKQQCYTLGEVSAKVFTDEDGDCDPDIVVYSSNWSVHLSKTSQCDGVEMTLTVFRFTSMPQIHSLQHWLEEMEGGFLFVLFLQNCNFIKHHRHTVIVTLVMMTLTQLRTSPPPSPQNHAHH